MNTDDLCDKLTRRLMHAWCCEPDYDAEGTKFCLTHTAGWLHDVDACARADNAASTLLPTVREALADAWDEGFNIGYADQANRDTTVPMPQNPWREASE